MKIIGTSFTKINIERLDNVLKTSEDLKINTSIDIPNIKEVKEHILNTKESVLEIDFSYKINYEPLIAKITLEGKLLISIENKIAKDVLQKWNTKEISEDFRISLFNVILRKSTLKALQFEEELNLPLHMPLPSLKKGSEKQK